MLGLYPDGSHDIIVWPTNSETLYPNADHRCKRQNELIVELGRRDYDLSKDDLTKYNTLLRDTQARLGYSTSHVPWNEVSSSGRSSKEW